MDAIHKLSTDNIRILAAAMVEKANSGHPGGPMGGADYFHILYSEFLIFDPEDMQWPHRDRFFMDAGHLSALLYAQLHLFNKYAKADLENFRQLGSHTPGHPEVDVLRGIENTSGPLGQGHTMGVGAAIAARFLISRFGSWMEHKIYAYISDGGVQEEISQGAGRIAGFLGLNNLIMFFDSNDVQLSTYTNEVTREDTAKKYEAWGWKVTTIDGHDHDQIREALTEAQEESERPFLIIGKTIIGKGAVDEHGQKFEGKTELHGMPLGNAGASFDKTVEALGGDSNQPFEIFPEVGEYYAKVTAQKVENARIKKQKEVQWRGENPDLADKLDLFLSGRIPELDFSEVEQKENVATRAASAAVLSFLAERVENLIVASADLSNSDKTDGFLKKSKALRKGDFSGAFLQAGVSELTMAALANGMALHGGVIPAIGTFFVFSDFMKPAVRLAAIMGLPVKYVWTHDAFRVGEDGPTHQPVEQEAQLRLLEKLRNHKGERSLYALRPSDASETTVAWKMALDNTKVPTGLILSRQNVKDIPAVNDSRYQEALAAEKGAYLVQETEDPDVILVANGSEVSTLVEGAALLMEKQGLKVSIVSCISEGLFRDQDPVYQAHVLPGNKPKFGLTAGLPINLSELVGSKGMVFGLDHFGLSAPAKILDQEFGFTAKNVYDQVTKYLETYKDVITN